MIEFDDALNRIHPPVEKCFVSSTLIDEIAANDGAHVVPITLDQYREMIPGGIILDGAPVELIDGVLLWKDRGREGGKPTGHDPRHALLVKRLLQLLQNWAASIGCHFRVQLPATLTERNEPEPDVAIVYGSADDFAERHPGPADIALAIEVADSSLRGDRTTKRRLYARFGIPAYWIVNLRSDQVEVYEHPDMVTETYSVSTLRGVGETLKLSVCGNDLPVDLAALLA